MKSVTVNVSDEDIKDLQEIFDNEPNFQPRARQDYLIIAILKQVLDNPKTNVSQ